MPTFLLGEVSLEIRCPPLYSESGKQKKKGLKSGDSVSHSHSTGYKTRQSDIYCTKPGTNLEGEGRELWKDLKLPTHLGPSKIVLHFISRIANPPSWGGIQWTEHGLIEWKGGSLVHIFTSPLGQIFNIFSFWTSKLLEKVPNALLEVFECTS